MICNQDLDTDYSLFPSPCYVVSEARFRRNLQLIQRVQNEAGVTIIMAFKAFALWKLFDIVRQYGFGSTASSLSEARLASELLGRKAHTYAPVYSSSEIEDILSCSSHITFNSLSQFKKYCGLAASMGVGCGIRVNPGYSPVQTDLYNPCVSGSRLGVTPEALGNSLPVGVTGLHCHNLCESGADDCEKTLSILEQKFYRPLQQARWLNLGGGHLMTRSDYDVSRLVSVLRAFRSRHPNLQVILEPGSAFAWQTGELIASVEDIVSNDGVQTAMLNVSFACHMPDCLEMPYQPEIIGASNSILPGKHVYRLGGNSCLSGDYCGPWSFDEPLHVGQRLVFWDMNHYTTVKTTMFNGVSHPSIALFTTEGRPIILRRFGFEDYKSRMD